MEFRAGELEYSLKGSDHTLVRRRSLVISAASFTLELSADPCGAATAELINRHFRERDWPALGALFLIGVEEDKHGALHLRMHNLCAVAVAKIAQPQRERFRAALVGAVCPASAAADVVAK